MSSNVSRNTFDQLKGYQKLIYSQQRPVLDAELNEQQDIYRRREELIEKSGIGNGAIGDGYLVIDSGSPNSILIYQGTYYNNGRELTLFNNVLLTGLTTPIGNRIDYAYIEYFDEEIDSTVDPNLIDPIIGIETAVRTRTTINLKVAEGIPIPTPPAGKTYVRIATLNRLAGNPNVTSTMIVDDRKKASRNFVVSGLRPAHTGALTFSVTNGDCFVANTKFSSVFGFIGAVLPNSTRYVYVDTTGTIVVAASLPSTFNTPIALITSNATTITALTDLRMFSNLATDTPRIDVSINTDGTFKDDVITLSNIKILRPHQQTSPNMTVYVESGTYIISNGQKAISFSGSSSPVFALPIGFPKIDLLTVDDNGNLVIIPGIPAAAPVAPTYPTDKQVVAEVTLTPVTTSIVNANIRDVRFFLNLGGGPGIQINRDDFSSASNQTVYSLTFSYNPGTSDLLVFSSGQIQTKGLDYLESSSNTVTFINGRVLGERVSVLRISGGGGGGGGAPQLYQFTTAIGGETLINIVSGSYTPNQNSLRVFRNGKKLTYTQDYTEPSGTTVLLATPAQKDDILEFIVEGGGGGGPTPSLQPRSTPITAFSADPTAAPSAGVISGAVFGAVAIDTIDFSNLVLQRIKFTVAAPRDLNTSGIYAISIQLWGGSGSLAQPAAGVFLRIRYAVLHHGDDLLLGGNRNTFSTIVTPFGTNSNENHFIDLSLWPPDFDSENTFLAFELERDPTDLNDTYNDIFRICEMRFKYVSA